MSVCRSGYMIKGVTSRRRPSWQRLAGKYGRATFLHGRFSSQQAPTTGILGFEELLANVGVYGGGLLLQHMHQQALGLTEKALQLVDDARAERSVGCRRALSLQLRRHDCRCGLSASRQLRTEHGARPTRTSLRSPHEAADQGALRRAGQEQRRELRLCSTGPRKRTCTQAWPIQVPRWAAMHFP